jgi:hypothetical protein
MAEGWAFARGVVIGSVHKFGYGHKFGGASAAPIVARRSEARDCSGIAGAGIIGVAGGATFDVNANQVFAWRKLSRRVNRTDGSSTDAGDGNARPAHRARAGARE